MTVNLLNIFSTSDKKKFRIDSVQFDDVEIEYNTTIGSVINQLGPLGSRIYPDGSIEIPSSNSIIQNDSIEIDASNYFQTMTLYGFFMLNLEITNGFPKQFQI